MNIKKCCFIGHRKIEITDELEKKVKDYVEYLILNENVKIFLFGSKSDFDSLCHDVVTKLKEKYPDIKRIKYTCKNETIILEKERIALEKVISNFQNKNISLRSFEEEFEHKTKYISNKASYIERNQAMINDSNYCLFYYNENYVLPKRKLSKKDVSYYQPQSGTKIAYRYAKNKQKKIKNFF